MRRENVPLSVQLLRSCAQVRYTADSVMLVAVASTLLSSNLGNILVDAVECLLRCLACRIHTTKYRETYLQHNDSVASDDNHTDAHFLAARLLLQRLVKYNVQVYLRRVSLVVAP